MSTVTLLSLPQSEDSILSLPGHSSIAVVKSSISLLLFLCELQVFSLRDLKSQKTFFVCLMFFGFTQVFATVGLFLFFLISTSQ